MTGIFRTSAFILLAGVVASIGCSRPEASLGTSGPWSAAEELQPADLAATLRGSGSKPTIVYVGYRALFHPGHIPGATYHGPASQPDGLADLKAWAASQPKDEPVVIYCGCCPFAECPNVKPGYDTLRALGFTKIRVLMLPTNFATDWVDKGYPVEK